jgi:hypothetical protein
MAIIRRSEGYLMRFDGRELPEGTAYHCCFCGSSRRLDIVRTMDGADACKWAPGFSVVCDCQASGPFSETRQGALSAWDSLMRSLEEAL